MNTDTTHRVRREIWPVYDGSGEFEVLEWTTSADGEPHTLVIGTLEACRAEYPDATFNEGSGKEG